MICSIIDTVFLQHEDLNQESCVETSQALPQAPSRHHNGNTSTRLMMPMAINTCVMRRSAAVSWFTVTRARSIDYDS